MQVCTLASSSRGNALVVSCGDIHILLDAGISALQIRKGLASLGLTPEKLSAILITHCHSDHVKGLTTLLKKHPIPLYATSQTEIGLRQRVELPANVFRPILPGQKFLVGDVEVSPFATPHDAQGSVGYRIQHEMDSMALVTDLGHITPEVMEGVCGVNLLIAEANHDVDWVRTSPYPYQTQQRILGDWGHLSNETGMELVVRAIRAGTGAVILAHLSPENNTPAHALLCAQHRLTAEGLSHIPISVAPANGLGQIHRISQGNIEILKEASLCSASI